MKKHILITLLLFLFIIPSIVFSQCPGAKAEQYKNKYQQYKDYSYSTLALYFAMKCECENGTASPEQVKAEVNSYVDQYNGLKSSSNGMGIQVPNAHQVQWITINKVSSCTKSSADNDSEKARNEDGTLDGEGSINKDSDFMKSLKTSLADQGIDQNVVNMIIAGDMEGAEKQAKINKQQVLANKLSNSLTEELNIDSQYSTVISQGIANSLGEIKANMASENKANTNEVINLLSKMEEYYTNLKAIPPNDKTIAINGFNNDYIKVIPNDGFETNIINDGNAAHIQFLKRIDKEVLREKNVYFIALEHPAINLAHDFEISFEVGYKYNENNNLWSQAPLFGIYLSAANRINVLPFRSNYRHSLTPVFNQFTGGKTLFYSDLSIKHPEVFNKVIYGESDLLRLNYTREDYKVIKKKQKEENKCRKSFGKYIENNPEKLVFVRYSISKKGDKISLTPVFLDSELSDCSNMGFTELDFDILSDSGKIFFGAASSYSTTMYKALTYGKDNEQFVIQNFSFKQ